MISTYLQILADAAPQLPRWIGRTAFNIRARKIVHYIVEPAAWSIQSDGRHITKGVCTLGMNAIVRFSPLFAGHDIVHFGSLWTFAGLGRRFLRHGANQIVVTVFHGRPGLDPSMDEAFAFLAQNKERVSAFVVTNARMAETLGSLGVRPDRIHKIPLGIDLTNFTPAVKKHRNKLRGDLQIPQDAICIGSFQKDGSGWGEGLEPKLIKGPDVFVNAVSELNQKLGGNIVCLLTGPARGFVKQGLQKAGVQFRHLILDNEQKVAQYYGAIDLYMVTSREEGGPKGILEALATGTPVVSTDVGMAGQLLSPAPIRILASDFSNIVDVALPLLLSEAKRNSVASWGLEAIRSYDWQEITKKYTALYQSLI